MDPSERSEFQIEGQRESSATAHQVLDEEAREVGVHNVFLGGFSQGGATALIAFLTYDPNADGHLGGFVGISGWLPMQNALAGFADIVRRQQSGQATQSKGHPPAPAQCHCSQVRVTDFA